MAKTRIIKVDYLARVEGEGSLVMKLRGKVAESVELRIFEPPRFFEGLLRGRGQLEAPDITARICGICPVAYQMSACRAIEDAHGITLDAPLRALRRLLYCGEWIESHVLHMVMLHAPDFLGYPDALAMAKDHGDQVKRGLRMKKAGNAIVALLGGREIHPINVRVGGFYRAPTRSELRALLPELDWARAAAQETLAWVATFEYPDLERDYEMVALRAADEYPMCEGRLVSNKGLDIAVRDYDAEFTEEHVARSNALHSTRNGHGSYLCGPLARINLDFDQLSPLAREAARAIGFTVPCANPFKSLLARGIEVVHAFDTAARIVEEYLAPDRAFVPIPEAAGTGYACTEAPRGILYHRYAVDERGLITDAKIVPPTSQNQRTIEEDLTALAPMLAELPHAAATARAEQAIRNYDPCISCATHFLTLRIEQGGPVSTRVIGLGQRFGGDDAVGVHVLERLRAGGVPAGVELIEAWDATHLIAALEGPGTAVVVDALVGPGPVGRVHVLAPAALGQDGLAAVSTHGLDVGQAIALAAQLYPDAARHIHVVGVEIGAPERFREGLSPVVAAAVPAAVAAVLELVNREGRRSSAMCLGIPGRVLTIEEEELRMGRVSFGGVVKRICLAYVPEAAVGDYVIVHAGFAISRVDEAAAARVFEVLEELGGVEPNPPE